MKVLAGLIGGLILAILGTLLVTINLAAVAAKGGNWAAIGFFVFWAAGFVIALMAKSAPKAWRHLLLTSAVFSFLLPLLGIVYTSSYMTAKVEPAGAHAGAQAARAAIGGGLISGSLGFIGLFLGAVLLIIGLLVGRDKQTIHLQAPPVGEPPSGQKR